MTVTANGATTGKTSTKTKQLISAEYQKRMGNKNQSSTKAPKKQLGLTKSISATGDVLADSNVDTDETPFDEMTTLQQIGRPTIRA